MIKCDEYLTGIGFKQVPRSEFQSDNVLYNFQKCYYTSEGDKKFFLDVAKYDWRRYGLDKDFTYEISCQLYSYGKHEAIDIIFHDDSIEEAEFFVNNLFINGFVEPYEI